MNPTRSNYAVLIPVIIIPSRTAKKQSHMEQMTLKVFGQRGARVHMKPQAVKLFVKQSGGNVQVFRWPHLAMMTNTHRHVPHLTYMHAYQMSANHQ